MHLNYRCYLSSSLVHVLALLCVSSLWSNASASAQAEQILVVSDEEVPDELSEAVSDGLADVGSVMSSSSYTSKARGRGQAPDSEEALTKLAPQTGASLIVVLRQARNRLKIELRNGNTGEIVGRTAVPARGKRPKLTKPARKRLIAAAKRAQKKVARSPGKRVSAEDDFAEDPAPKQPARQAAQPSRPAPVLDEPEPEEVEEESASAAPAELDAEEPPPRAEPAADGGGMLFRLRAGLGLGTRSIVVPTPPGRMLGNRIDTSFVPSLDIGAALELPLGPKWALRFLADYRTIFGLTAGYQSAPGVMATSSLSSHSLIGGASLGHLSDGRDSFGVHVFVGWAWRSLSAAEPSLPDASIQGLVLRPELEIPIPIAGLKLALRLAPELILILVPEASLPANDSALAKALGYAFGAEASLDLQINQTIGVSFQFRESRGSTPSGWGSSAIENERYLALRLLLRF